MNETCILVADGEVHTVVRMTIPKGNADVDA